MKKNYALFDNVLPVKEIREPERDIAIHARELQLSFYEEQKFTSETIPSIDRSRNDATQSRLLRAAKAVQLNEEPTEPGIYYVTSTLEKVGERQLPERITTIQEAANATAYLSRYAVEHYDAIVTNYKGKPLAVIGSFKGTETQTSVYPATVIKELAKIKGAAHLWASHNHPSGVSELSKADLVLNEAFETLLRGSGVEYHGLLAIAGNNYSSSSHVNGVISDDIGKTLRVPVAERMLKGSPLHHLMMSNPKTSKILVQQIAKEVPGIVFLSSQYAPVSFIPVNPNELRILRTEGRLMRLFNAAASSGAVTAIIANPNNAIQTRPTEAGGITAANNLASALQAIDVRVLDVISYDPLKPDQAISEVERGYFNPIGKFFSKEVGQSKNPHDTNTATQALLNAFTGSSKASIAAMLESGKARVITSQQAQHLVDKDALFMKAWHGSPHDHIRFDMSKVGTGEGNQAYGHGLYFARSRGVAEHYKNALASVQTFYKGEVVPKNRLSKITGNVSADKALFALAFMQGDFNRAFDSLKGQNNVSASEWLKNNRSDIQIKKEGRLYQVELNPTEDEYMLWDKPLSEQSEKVKVALEKLPAIQAIPEADRKAFTEYNGKFHKESTKPLRWPGATLYGNIETTLGQNTKGSEELRNILGISEEEAYKARASELASNVLHSLGVRGIKYLDGRSRNAGEGNFNYVIFNDKDVSITAKFSQEKEQPSIPTTETEAFINWFGDSKVVDVSGKPLIVYHGTEIDSFNSFDLNKISSSSGNAGFLGKGFYFSPEKSIASAYGNVKEVYLALKNPLLLNGILDDKTINVINKASDTWAFEVGATADDVYAGLSYSIPEYPEIAEAITENLSNMGYDGIIYKSHRNNKSEIVAFSPEQIKLAIGNNGQFDGNNPDIRYSNDSTARTMGFYNPPDGITYFIADHISKEYTPQEWRGLALHEIAVHAMQFGRDNDEFKSILNDFEKMKEAGDKKVIKAYNKVPTKTRTENVTEEAFAYYIQHNHDMPLTHRFVAWMRNSIRAMGTAMPFTQRAPWAAWASALTPNDLVYMAHAALSKNLEGSQREYTDDVALASKTNERFYSQLYKAYTNQSLHIDDMYEEISRIKGQWPAMPPVHVINDVSELPFAENKNARGIYSQNNIYIVAPKIFSIPELQKVMAHEYILHHSFFEMFDHYDFSKIHTGIQSLKERGDPTICKIVEHIAQVYDPLSPEDETREIIAHAGEECLDERGNIKKEYGFMKPVFANFASWLRDHGIGVPFSNYELQGIIVNVGKYAQREAENSLVSLKGKTGLYSGKILDVQGNIVIQKTGCKLTDIERHLFSASATKPIIGEVVNIAYKNKQPTVLTKEKQKVIDI